MSILIRCFYFGIFYSCKHALDVMVGGDFLKCGETQDLNVINGFIDFLTHESYKIDGITTRLDRIERALCKLNLKEVNDILKVNATLPPGDRTNRSSGSCARGVLPWDVARAAKCQQTSRRKMYFC